MARADLGVVLADPTTIGASRWTDAGHSMVYFSGVCAASPVRARLCGPGEQGSVLTRFPDFREARPYDWNLVPLGFYLYGSSSPEERLLFASGSAKQALEAHGRQGFLKEVCSGACPQTPHSYWRDLIAATADRDVFIYAARTTRAQDQAVVGWLNSQPNVNRYHPLTNNCADFTRAVINLIFPHSVHRDLLNDLGMMGPKAAARSFTRWAVKRPELGLYSMHFAQQPGPLPRCGLARSGTEAGFHEKKYLIPVALIGDHEVAGSLLVAYYLTGRFGLYREFSLYPAPSVVSAEAEARAAQQEGDGAESARLRVSVEVARARVVGTPGDWASYQERFARMLAEDATGVEAAQGKQFFPAEYATAKVEVDAKGLPWLVLGEQRVGLGSGNLLAASSDPQLALGLMLGRVRYALAAKDHMRETMPEFARDWALLEQAQARFAGMEQARLAGQDAR